MPFQAHQTTIHAVFLFQPPKTTCTTQPPFTKCVCMRRDDRSAGADSCNSPSLFAPLVATPVCEPRARPPSARVLLGWRTCADTADLTLLDQFPLSKSLTCMMSVSLLPTPVRWGHWLIKCFVKSLEPYFVPWRVNGRKKTLTSTFILPIFSPVRLIIVPLFGLLSPPPPCFSFSWHRPWHQMQPD